MALKVGCCGFAEGQASYFRHFAAVGDPDDLHGVDPFKDRCLSEGPIYYRLHGIGGYRYRYGDGDLQKLLLLCEGREGFVMFNNMTMKEDALRFIACLRREEKSCRGL